MARWLRQEEPEPIPQRYCGKDQKRGFKALAMDAILYPLVKEDAQYFSQQYNDLWAWQIELQ